jgi:hypothetical protein
LSSTKPGLSRTTRNASSVSCGRRKLKCGCLRRKRHAVSSAHELKPAVRRQAPQQVAE